MKNCTHRMDATEPPCAACQSGASTERDQLLLVSRELNLAMLDIEISTNTAEQLERIRSAINASRLLVVELAGHEFARGESNAIKIEQPATPLKVWQYALPSVKGEGWAHVMIREDGFFSAVSDWGNFAFIWGSTGESDVRRFFLRMERDWDYFARKFECGRRERVDSDKSTDAFKRALLRVRRDREMSREHAAEDWEKLQQHSDDWEGIIRECWNFDSEPWRFAILETSDAVWFCQKIGPRLVKAIQEQLDSEKVGAK